MSSGFVSSKEIEEERKTRQEEWEKVRNPDDSLIAPEPEICNKTLFEQLRDNKEVKQSEIEEAKKFKNMIRGVDEDESEFLAQVDNEKHAMNVLRKKEEQEMLKELAKTQTLSASAQKTSFSLKPSTSQAPPAAKVSKQASLIGSAIKRKSESIERADTKVAKVDENIQNAVESAGVVKQVAAIRGIIDYEASSDSESSNSESDDDEVTLPILQTKSKKSNENQECSS